MWEIFDLNVITMETSIIKIGNSKGIIIPSNILDKAHLSLKSIVRLSLEGDDIVIRTNPRKGWAEAAKQAHKSGDDKLLVSDVFEDEKFEDWTW